MASSAGGFNTPITADVRKASASHVSVIPAAGTAQVVNPVAPINAFTAFNVSSKWVRGTITFAAGVTNDGSAATTVFLIPPQGTYSQDYASDSGVTGDVPAVDSISYVSIATPTASAEASTLAALVANADATVVTNFVQK